jgi:equilibrative nucleoside transporter 1/2/3
MALSFARTAFIPLFLMCNIQRPGVTSVPTAPIITSDLLYLLILFAFGWSNGYVASLCMMSAPSLEHNPRLKGRKEEVDVAATIVSFCAIFGLALGSLASFGVSALVCGCNPFLT